MLHHMPKGAADEHISSSRAVDAAAQEPVRAGGTRSSPRATYLLNVLVAEGLDEHASTRELLEQVAAHYRARLANEGRLQEASDHVLHELRDLREQIARDLYS